MDLKFLTSDEINKLIVEGKLTVAILRKKLNYIVGE